MEEDLLEPTSPDIQTVETRETDNLAKIIVVRHAESLANGGGIFQGQTHDTDLSELGIKQAKALANRLKDFSISRIISSPLKRSYQTALEIAKVLDCEIEVRNEIIETNHGNWEGRSKDWILQDYKELYDLWLKKPSEVIFPEGEHFTETAQRVEEFMYGNEFLEDTVIVSHDNIVRIMTAIAHGDPIDSMWHYQIEPAALNIFEINQVGGRNRLRALQINDVAHLMNLRADLKKHAL